MEPNELLGLLAKALTQVQTKHDLPAGYTLSDNFLHGPTGIFGVSGTEQDIFSTHVLPRGLLSVLQAAGTIDENPIQAYLTGFTEGSGDEPSTSCGDAPIAGEIKSCLQGTVFGLVQRATDEMDVTQIGRRNHRHEPMDLRLVNEPLLGTNFAIPSNIPKELGQIMQREILARFLTVGVEFEQVLGRMIYTGDPANNVGTGYKEFFGLESLVTTGHTDVITQDSCPSLDSYLFDLNYATVEDNADTIFNYMTNAHRLVDHNALTMNMYPVEWAWVMQDSLFRELTDYWPCIFASYRCGGTVSNNTDALAMRQMSMDMYNGRYLLIDGKRQPVIIDDHMPYDTNANNGEVPQGAFSSDIYYLPFTVKGGKRVLYMEYFDYRGTNGTWTGIQDGWAQNEFNSNDGKFLWTFSRTNWCLKWQGRIEPRLRLLTPHLAARIQNVVWQPLQMFRMPRLDDPYHVNGGVHDGRENAPYTYSDGRLQFVAPT